MVLVTVFDLHVPTLCEDGNASNVLLSDTLALLICTFAKLTTELSPL